MNTLTKTLLLFLPAVSPLVLGQQIRFEEITSSNAMALVNQSSNSLQLNPSGSTMILQNGNQNYTEARVNANTNLQVKQNGDFNYIHFNNSFQNNAGKATITAQGNNTIIDVTGTNSISEQLKIQVKGDNTTIFMRNY